MARRAAGQVLFLRSGMVLLGLVFSAGCGLVARSGDQDARAVYCLAPAQRPALADAAVVLGLAQHGSGPDRLKVAGKEMTLETWRVAYHDDFARGCAALEQAGRPASGESSTVQDLLDLGRVAFGALLGAVAGEWRAKVATGRLEAEGVRSAIRAYVRAATVYIVEWQSFSVGDDRPNDRPVREREDDADAQLRRCHLLHPRWKAPSRSRAELTGLTERIADARGWADLDGEAKNARANELRTRLTDFESGTDLVAAALERPWRPHRPMTTGSAAPGDPAPAPTTANEQ